jgi:hypothetical protein
MNFCPVNLVIAIQITDASHDPEQTYLPKVVSPTSKLFNVGHHNKDEKSVVFSTQLLKGIRIRCSSASMLILAINPQLGVVCENE